MYPIERARIAAIATLLFISNSAYSQAQTEPNVETVSAQSLSLFEDVETTGNRASSPGRPTRESRVTNSEPEFTLVGTSRIGERYSAMVRHKSGEVILVKGDQVSSTAIQGYADYSIVKLAAGAISIQQPGNIPCIEFSDLGVHCNAAGNIVELVLANGEPLPSTSPAIINRSNDGSDSGEETDDLIVNPANPFEALRDAQNERVLGGQAEGLTSGRFTPRRINPADVPEGKRVVSTPFGDRLVDL